MKGLTIKGVVCIMFGIANKNYVIRPDSNSYLILYIHNNLREHQDMLLGHVQDL